MEADLASGAIKHMGKWEPQNCADLMKYFLPYRLIWAPWTSQAQENITYKVMF